MLTPAEIRDMNIAAQDQGITGVHPALHLARAVEAATLATVTPLVQQLVEALEQPDYQARAERHHALTAARAFLSGATKESPRQQQGGVRWSEEWRRFHSINAELGEVRARLAQISAAQPAQAGADRAGG